MFTFAVVLFTFCLAMFTFVSGSVYLRCDHVYFLRGLVSFLRGPVYFLRPSPIILIAAMMILPVMLLFIMLVFLLVLLLPGHRRYRPRDHDGHRRRNSEGSIARGLSSSARPALATAACARAAGHGEARRCHCWRARRLVRRLLRCRRSASSGSSMGTLAVPASAQKLRRGANSARQQEPRPACRHVETQGWGHVDATPAKSRSFQLRGLWRVLRSGCQRGIFVRPSRSESR